MTVQKAQHDTSQASNRAAQPSGKKAFVEPAISQPVDVLEATTFFQVADSGGTGIRRKGD